MPTCPDCGIEATHDDRLLIHLDTCPLPRARRAQVADDAVWLAEHPQADRRVRPLTRAETVEVRGLIGASVTVGSWRPGGWKAVVMAADGPCWTYVYRRGRLAGVLHLAEP